MLLKRCILIGILFLLLSFTGALVAMTGTRHLSCGNVSPAQSELQPKISEQLAHQVKQEFPNAQNTLIDTRQQYQRDLARLSDLSKANDLDGLVKFADELEVKWGRRGGDDYARLMLNISNLIVNDFYNEKIYQLSQKYIFTALSKSDSFSLDSEVKLLPFLAIALAPSTAPTDVTSAWAKERNIKAKLWLHAWFRLEKEIDRKFNFNDKPFLNITPPVETGLPSGVAPEAIKDARLRALYEAEITANAKKARIYNRQYILRQIEKEFPQKAENYIVSAYSKSPINPNELEQLLNTYIGDYTTRERIKDEVKRRRSGTSTSPEQ